MFQPNPGPRRAWWGSNTARRCKAAVGPVLRSRSNDMGKIGNAIFDGISKDRTIVTSTLIGVMMGFLPTVDGNIRGALYEWVTDRSLWDLSARLSGRATEDRLERAMRVLMPRLEETCCCVRFQNSCGAPRWWRILSGQSRCAGRPDRGEHRLGDAGMPEQGRRDGLYFIFGGKRSEKNHPTHACPATRWPWA